MGDLQSSPRAWAQPLSPEDQFYDRQLRVAGWGPEGQTRLKQASVLVVGAGGLGCPALLYLAGAGVGRLGIIDPDTVSLSNLPRQVLFTVADQGRPKAVVAAEVLRRQNPWIAVEALPTRLDRSNVRGLVEGYDLILDGTDNFATKYLLHDACYAAAKPLVMASLYQWEAQLQVFAFDRQRTGCLRCLYPTAPEDGCVGTCAEVGVAGALAGSVGSLQALAAVQLLLGQPSLTNGQTLLLDYQSWQPRQLRWAAVADCPCCSRPPSWDWLEADEPAVEKTWPELIPADRQVVIDLRQPEEIQPGEWEFFRAAGCQVAHHPLTEWQVRPPTWQPNTGYLLLCAKGIRSLHALALVPAVPGSRFLSLTGGIRGLRAAQVLD